MYTENNNFCPLVNNPEADCFCLDLTSAGIIQILSYCKNNYKKCRIYQKVINMESA